MEIPKVLSLPTPTHESKCPGQISLLLDRFPEAVADLVKAAELRPDFALATVQVRKDYFRNQKMINEFAEALHRLPFRPCSW